MLLFLPGGAAKGVKGEGSDLGVSLDVAVRTALSRVRQASLASSYLVPEVWSNAFKQGLVIRLDA